MAYDWSTFILDEWNSFSFSTWDTFLLDPVAESGGALSGIVYGSGVGLSFLSVTRYFESLVNGGLDASGYFSIWNNDALDLLIYGVYTYNDSTTLFIEGEYAHCWDALYLYLCHYYETESLSFIIKGLGTTPGALLFDDSITLFIGDHLNYFDSLFLFVASITDNVSGDLTLYINSTYNASSGLDLVIPASLGTINDSCKLFSYGF